LRIRVANKIVVFFDCFYIFFTGAAALRAEILIATFSAGRDLIVCCVLKKSLNLQQTEVGARFV
jgi:hypothetical protein